MTIPAINAIALNKNEASRAPSISLVEFIIKGAITKPIANPNANNPPRVVTAVKNHAIK